MFQTLSRSAALAAVFATGCGGLDPPDDLSCNGPIRSVFGDDELSEAVRDAARGDCILLATGTYLQPLFVTVPGVTIAAGDGEQVTLQSMSIALLIDAADVRVHGLRIRGGRHGIFVSASHAQISDVIIEDASAAAVWIKCEDSGCMGGMPSILENVDLLSSEFGLFADNANVRVRGGHINDNTSQQLGGGGGVYAVAGATVELERTEIARNSYGVIADGPATTLRLIDAIVQNNTDLGVWGQGLRGTTTTPALELRGALGRVSENSVVGLGVFDSAGIVARHGEISRTIEREVLIDLTRLVPIGDGITLLSGSNNVSVESLRLIDNQRAQAVVDAPGAGVAFAGSNTVSGGRRKIVVQNGGQPVTVPASDTSTTAAALPVFEMPLPVPVLTP